MKKRLPFNFPLYKFLQTEGYTHIQLRGIENGADNYILVPWKEDIGKFEESDFQMEEIHSADNTNMFAVEFGIQFWVELPQEIADRFHS